MASTVRDRHSKANIAMMGANKRRRVIQSSLVSLFDPNRYPPIRDVLSAMLTSAGLWRLSAASKLLRSEIPPHEWNINRALRRFFDQPIAFRSVMAEHNALITGDFALGFLDRKQWQDTRLVLFVKQHTGNMPPLHFFIRGAGYQVIDTCEYEIEEEDLQNSMVTEIIYGRGSQELSLVYSNDLPMVHILKLHCRTDGMNIISWNAAYCLFPRLTFLEYESIHIELMDRPRLPHLTEPARSGWQQIAHVRAADFRHAGVANHDFNNPRHNHESLRRVGDCRTWKVNLDVEGIKEVGFPDKVLEHASFGISTSHEEEWGDYADLSRFVGTPCPTASMSALGIPMPSDMDTHTRLVDTSGQT